MKPAEILKEVQEQAGEWLEMSDNPHLLLAWLLCVRVSKQDEYIEYLEKVNEHTFR